ncbi:MAG: hypothetical protein U1A72_13330 [Sulfuritalea sp.]|nr:hypothetical protein [Sulfuritalea sp.]
MKFLRNIAVAIGVTVAAVALAAAYFPVPSNIWATGDVVVAQDANNLTGVAAVASGQVLTSAGTATKPAWSASPSLTSLTLGSGTAITKIQVLSATITPTQLDLSPLGQCEEQSFTLTGLTSADKVAVNPAFATNASAYMTTARASTGADTILITFCQVSTAAATPAGGTINVLAVRS